MAEAAFISSFDTGKAQFKSSFVPETVGIICYSGEYLLTGQEVGTTRLHADSGIYNLTGSRLNQADPGAYLITGMSIEFNRINTESGAYSVVPSDIHRLLPDAAAFVLTGQEIDLNKNINVAGGSYLITGKNLLRIHAESGAMLLSGTGIDFVITAGPSPVGQLVYFCTLTGSPDLDLGIKSFQARLRSGTPTFLQVVVSGIENKDEINLRPSGMLRIESAYIIDGVVTDRTTIIEADFADISVYDGAENKSITLIGYSTTTYPRNSIILNQVSYRNTLNGFIRYRLPEPNVYIHPGDQVTVGSETFVANVLSYYIGTDYSVMELAEE